MSKGRYYVTMKYFMVVLVSVLFYQNSLNAKNDNDLNQGLSGLWSFDDQLNPGKDYSTYQNNGTCLNITSINGVVGKALRFNGNAEVRIENKVADNPELNMTNDASVSFWFATTQTPGSGYISIIRHEHHFTPLQFTGTDGRAAAVTFVGPDEPVAGLVFNQYDWIDNQYSDGDWHHMVVTFDGGNGQQSTSVVSVWYDGTKILTSEVTGLLNPNDSANHPWMFGRHENGSSEAYVGDLDQIRFYSRVLSDEEIISLFEEPENPVDPPEGQEPIHVMESASKRVLVPSQNIGDSWRTDVNFNDSGWMLCQGSPGGVGYENNSGYQNLISCDVGDKMTGNGSTPNASCYIRIPFTVDESDLAGLNFMQLNIHYDDGFIAYLNGQRVASAYAPASPAWNSSATGSHESNSAASYNLSQYINFLNAGDNLLAIHGLNTNTTSSDFLILPELYASVHEIDESASSNLPLVFIDTHGQTIVDNPRIIADMGIVYNGEGERNYLIDPRNDYNGRIAIELRGTTSINFDKKPYRIETQDSLGENLNVSLLGMPAENDWVFQNPWSDKTLIRNVVAYKISNDLDRYASRTRLCEVYLNNEYQGVYVLMEKIKRDNDRVDISEMDSDDVAGDSLTGGYIIKLDKLSGELVDGWNGEDVYYQYHYPKPDEIRPQQKSYIQNFIKNFESVMKSKNYNDPVNGYSKYINLDSFVDYFIINEVCRNIDAYRLSTFMYKERDSQGGKLTMGPVWDFNLSFGNGDYFDGWKTDGWNLDLLLVRTQHEFHPPFWMGNLRNDTAFKTKLYNRWHVLRSGKLQLDYLLNYIDLLADSLDEAQKRNFEKWDILGRELWPNWFVGDTYQEEIDFMKTWLEDRIAWMDQEIEAMDVSGVETHDNQNRPDIYSLYQNHPNPFNPATEIRFSIPESETVRIEIFDVLGGHVQTLLDKPMKAGSHSVNFNADHLSSGVYYYRISAGSFQKVKKMLLLK